MLATATSFLTNKTSASTPAPNPPGARPWAWRRCTCRPAYQIVRNTSAAATSMNTTCLVGETSSPNSLRTRPPPPPAPHRLPPVGPAPSLGPSRPPPSALVRLRPPLSAPVRPCYAVVDPHRARERADEAARDGEQRPRVQPAVHEPARAPEQQHRDGDGEGQRDVLIPFAEATRSGGGRSLVVRHRNAGKLCACERKRKPTANGATLCGAWWYD